MAEAFGIACHELVSLDFRCGSGRDQGGPSAPRRLSGVEPKKSAYKRTLRLEGLLSAPDSGVPAPARPFFETRRVAILAAAGSLFLASAAPLEAFPASGRRACCG